MFEFSDTVLACHEASGEAEILFIFSRHEQNEKINSQNIYLIMCSFSSLRTSAADSRISA